VTWKITTFKLSRPERFIDCTRSTLCKLPLDCLSQVRCMGYWSSLFGQDGWILAKFFFWGVYGPRPRLAKQKTRSISSHLDRTSLVNKGFITWLSGKFFLRDTAVSPERARKLHLGRSGSQSQRRIWFILPAHGASHITVYSWQLSSSFLSRLKFVRTDACRASFLVARFNIFVYDAIYKEGYFRSGVEQ